MCTGDLSRCDWLHNQSQGTWSLLKTVGSSVTLLALIAEETLLQYQDLASSLQLLKAEHFSTGLELVHQIKERLFAILWHSTQVKSTGPLVACLALV